MKIFHISDLHLGKRLNEFSLLEDQRHILREILLLAESRRPDLLILAGDLYDKSIPAVEAVSMLDDFLSAFVRLGIPVCAISGNHDSPDRIDFGSRIFARSGVYLSCVYQGRLVQADFQDAYGPVHVFLLPFVRPADVRPFFPDRKIDGYPAAMEAALSSPLPDPAERNLLVTHQFVLGASRCDSEEVNIGGTDGVPANLFRAYDYVALGHLHAPQAVGRAELRYSGSPLKYSFSEASQTKSVTEVVLEEKGSVRISELPLRPLRDLKRIRGRFEELSQKCFYDGTEFRECYLDITLTDEQDVPDALQKLRLIYPYIMHLGYDNRRTRQTGRPELPESEEELPAEELIREFYRQQNGQELTSEQAALLAEILEETEAEP